VHCIARNSGSLIGRRANIGRKAGIWWRESESCWYTTHRGKQERLDPDKGRARLLFHRLKGEWPADSEEGEAALTLGQVQALYLDYLKAECAPGSLATRSTYLEDFVNHIGADTEAATLRKHHLTSWLRTHPNWAPGTQRLAQSVIAAAVGYAHTEEYLEFNPYAGLRLPQAGRRDQLITGPEFKRWLPAIGTEHLRYFIRFLASTGCRAFSEAARLSASNYNSPGRVFTLEQHKTRKKTGKPRRIYVDEDIHTMVLALSALYPTGPLFRSGQTGKAWKPDAVRRGLLRACCKANLPEITPHVLRHSYITKQLLAGRSVELVAELTGTSPEMIHRVYSHLDKRPEALQAAASIAAFRG
jgi:integrase